MFKLKKLSSYNLLLFFLLLGLLILVFTIFYYFHYSQTNHSVSDISRLPQNSEVNHYYSPQVYHLPSEIAASAEDLMKNTKNKATSTINLPILLYHYIEPIKPNDHLRDSLTVTPEKFSEQLNLIKRSGWQTVSVSQAADRLKNPNKKEKQIALTFDDGYRDFYKYAFPLLKQYNIKATIYIIYDAINNPAYLTEDMIKEMLASGLVEIGSHTLDHKKLTLLDGAEAKRQISLSKTMLEKRFKIPIVSFAYPYGSFNLELTKLVQTTGYEAAVSVVSGEKQSEANRFFLSRLRSINDGGNTLLKRLLSNN